MGTLTGCTPELELVPVTVIVKVPAGVPVGGGGGGVEPPPQPMQSSTTNAPAPVAKTQRGMRLLALSQQASRTITSRQMAHSGQVRTLKLAGRGPRVGQGASWPRAVVVTVIPKPLPVVGFGLKSAVVPAGNPVAVKVKLSAKPEAREIVTP